jgi:uncharacterized protein
MSHITLLWHLQTLDHDLDTKTARHREVLAVLASDPTASARAAHDAEQKHLNELRTSLRDRDLEAKTLDAKIKQVEERLYSGRVTNPKELEGIQQDAQMHKRQRSKLDDAMLGLMDEVEAAQKRVAETSHALEQAEATRAHAVEKLTRERDELVTQIAALTRSREQTRASLDANSLGLYERLRAIKAGRAVAQIKHDACGVCGVSIPTGIQARARNGDELVFCPSCGRILTI